MQKNRSFYRIGVLFLLLLLLLGCSPQNKTSELQPSKTIEETHPKPTNTITESVLPTLDQNHDDNSPLNATVIEIDCSAYFAGLQGTAVLYDPQENCYQIYHPDLALTRRSPCSTFKIVSSLIALEKGIIQPNNTVRTWSGETFWNEDWNQDMDFDSAFRTSCVWYFREVIDDIGKDTMQKALHDLAYGNCDISDWEGRLNTNNDNPALTGFWIESSLTISPKEQVQVLERIFGEQTEYSPEALHALAQVMLLPEQDTAGVSIYGKTGMGKDHGIVVDAWFTGFVEISDRKQYFCVYLGETEGKNVSSTRAKEIALQIVADFYGSVTTNG